MSQTRGPMHKGLRYRRGATGEPAARRTLDLVSGVAVSGMVLARGLAVPGA